MPPRPHPPHDEGLLSQAVEAELREGVRAVSLAGLLGASAVLLILAVAQLAGWSEPKRVPALVGLLTAMLFGTTWWFSKRGLLSTRALRAAMYVLVSLPTAGFLLAEWTAPHGMGTYLAGGLPTVYSGLVGTTALVFDARLSRRCGWFAGLQLLAVGIHGRAHLMGSFTTNDPLLYELVTSSGLWLTRVVMVVAVGYVAGALASLAQKLSLRVLSDEREYRDIHRLFGEYVRPEVRERLVAQRTTEHADQVEVAVLFCDLRGFTSASEGVDPRALVAELNAYFDVMVREIHEHGGTVDKFVGDAVMAVFGGLAPLDNPCASAFDAARAMEAALSALNAERARAGRPAWSHGTGIHFGLVVQGPLGSTERKDFTIIGDAVNTAARLEKATRSLGRVVVLSDACFARLPADRQALCERHGELALKGKAKSVVVHCAGGELAGSARAVDDLAPLAI